MPKVDLPPSEGLYPVPVVLVSCLDRSSGKSNIITIAWCGVVCSAPPHISISIRPARLSFKIINDTRDFVINIPSAEMVREVDICGVHSGTDTDKFKLCHFTEYKSSKISSPGIEQCPVNIECLLKKTVDLGSHHMFIGEVVKIHADRRVVDAGGRIDFGIAKPFVYNLGEYWNLGEKIGYYGFSKKEV